MNRFIISLAAVATALTAGHAWAATPEDVEQSFFPYRESAGEDRNVLNQTIEDVARFGTPFDNLLQAGEISLFRRFAMVGQPWRSNSGLSASAPKRESLVELALCSTFSKGSR